MSNGLARINDGAALAPAFNPTPEQRQMIRDAYANGASDAEFSVLMEIARARQLNPLLRQIHFVKRWNNELRRETWSAQVSIDGLRAIAQRTGLYAGQDEPEFVEGADNGYPVLCKVRVYRTDWQRPAVGVAYWREYVQTTKDGAVTKMWRQFPHVMLAKVAESIALRKAFPEDIGGLYSDAEMAQAEHPADDERAQRRPAIDAAPAADVPDTTAPAAPPPAPSDLTPEHEAALEEFYARVAEVELPSEAVAVWMKHRAALSPIVARERENAWKALCSRVEEVGQMKNARVWLKKAIAEEDARRAAAEQRNPDDNDPTPGGGRRKAATKAADAAGDGADDRQTPVEGPAAWLASEDTTRAHVAAQRTEWEVQASARKHGRHLAAVAWGVRVYAERLQAMGVGTASQCERYVSAWAKAGPVVRAATAQRRAA